MPNITNITPPRVPLTDPATGLISREWYRFFLNLFQLTGSGTTDVTLPDLQLGPPVSPEAFAEINRVYNDALLNAPSVQLGTLSSVNQDNVRYLGFQTVPALNYTPPVGTVYWNGGTTLTIQNTPNVAQPVGEAQYFYIKATSAITKGQLIMFTGAVGSSGQLTGAPATGVTTGEYLMGVAAEDIALNAFGIVTSFGLVRGFDTTGGAEAWVDGQILYYDPTTPGKMTKTIPSAPNVKAIVAAVVNAAPGGAGSVFVRVSFGSKLGETDSNVQITSLTDGDLLQYDSALGYWKNIKPLNVTSGGTGLTNIAANRIPYAPALNTYGTSANLTFNGTTLTAAKGHFNQVSATNLTDYAARFTQSLATINAGRVVFDQNSTYAFATSLAATGSTTATMDFQWITFATGALSSTNVQFRYDGDVAFPNSVRFGSLTAPTATVDITGTLKVSGAVTLTTPLAVGSGGTGLSSGTSGGIPYFSATNTMASSAALLSGGIVVGGGAGATPYTPSLANLIWDDTNKRLGIGVSVPTTTLHVNGSYTDPGLNGLARFVASIDATANGTNYGTIVQTAATISGGTTAQIRNYQYNLNFTISGVTGGTLYNVFQQPVIAGANSGTLTNYYNYYINDYNTSSFTGSVTISNTYGIRIANLADTITNVTKTNTYALYIDAQSGTTTTTRAIYAAGGTSVHVGSFRFGGTTAPGATVDVTGDIRASGAIRSSTITALGTTGTVSLDPTLGTVFTVTPTGNITFNAASVIPGQFISLVVTTSGATSRTLTFGTNFKSTGTLATGTVTAKVFTVTFVADSTNYNEVSRTVAM